MRAKFVNENEREFTRGDVRKSMGLGTIHFDKFEDRIKHLRNIYGSSDNKFIINYY